MWFKRNILWLVLFFDIILCVSSAIDGARHGDITYRFQERQTVTFFSAFMLGLTGFISYMIWRVKRKLHPGDKGKRFWALSSCAFFYLMLDEYFMAHEGFEDAISFLLGRPDMPIEADWFVMGLYGVFAIFVCLYFRKEVIKHKKLLPFLIGGGIGLFGTALFDFLNSSPLAIVIEESFKIIGVSYLFVGFLMTLFELI